MSSPYLQYIKFPVDFVPIVLKSAESSIPGLFREIAGRMPNKPAVHDHVSSLTYSELERLSRNTAAFIQQELGPDSGPKGIALIFDPTVESIIGIMGVLESSNFICPISPHDPPQKILNYLEDADIEIILSCRKCLPSKLQNALGSRKLIFIEEIAEKSTELFVSRDIDSNQICALLYSSGSTGIPKGVVHTHQTLLQMVMNKGNAQGLTPSENVACLSTFTFGSYYWNVFATLTRGCTLHLYDIYKFSFEALGSWITERRINQLHCTPTALRQFLDTLAESTSFPDLRLVSLGGENVYPGDVRKFQRLITDTTTLGSTGTTIETYYFTSIFFSNPFPDDIQEIPMGFIIPECRVEVRDDKGSLLPHGQIGEICIYNKSLSTGYWKRLDLDSQKYGSDEKHGRYFRSGDLGILTAEGLLYHKGRSDFQIKIRGMRVDLGEVESMLIEHPQVKRAVVIGRPSTQGEMQLVSYIVKETGASIGRDDIFTFLSAHLSPNQIPTWIVFLESFPLTRTHKVDRMALPDPDESDRASGSKIDAPRTEIEARIHKFWENILGHNNFGVKDDFLKLGGDSLGAMRILMHIKHEYDVSIPLQEIFKSATIESLATIVKDQKR